MQLTYRGSQYPFIISTVSTRPSGLRGTYRGAVFTPNHPVSAPSSLNLVYRGAQYRPEVDPVELPGLLTTF